MAALLLGQKTHSQQTQPSLSSPETLDSAHVEMSSTAGQNIPPSVARCLQQLLFGSSCPWHSLRSRSSMGGVDGRFTAASAAHSHVLGYLRLQPWYGLRGGTTSPLQHLCTSARCRPACNCKTQNQHCPVVSKDCQTSMHHSLPRHPVLPRQTNQGLIKA